MGTPPGANAWLQRDGDVTTVTFKGCKTREQALQRVSTWLDGLYDEQLRAHGARMIASDESPEEIAWQLLQLRGVLLEYRAETLAWFAAKFEELQSGVMTTREHHR